MKIFISLLLLLVSLSNAKETHILSIHSYHESYLWTKEQQAGFRDYIDTVAGSYPLYSTEYLDTKRRKFDKDYEDEIAHYFTSKYKEYSPDVIYVTDDNALKFVLNHKEKIFPKSPIVFSGVNDKKLITSLDKKSYVGIEEEKDFVKNIKLIKELFPQEKQLLIFGDGSTTAEAIYKTLGNDLLDIPDMNVTYVNHENFEQAYEELNRYRGKIILLTTIGGFRNARGGLIPLKEAIHYIVKSGFVTFAMEDDYVQQGVVGGYCTDGFKDGQAAGKLAAEILSIPITMPKYNGLSSNSWIFDFNALEKYDITLAQSIASQSVILNQPESFYSKYEQFITIVLSLMIFTIILGILIFSAHLYRSRRLITQREQDLNVVATRLNKAQQIANLGNWEWNIQTNELWWSDQIYRIFGLQPQEFVPTYDSFLHHVHPDDKESVQEAVNYAFTHAGHYHTLHRIVKKDGVIRHVLEEGDIISDDMRPLKMIGTVHDITEQIEIQKALEKSEAQYKGLVENSMAGIYRTLLDGTIVYANPAMVEMLSYDSQDDLIGKNAREIYSSKDTREVIIKNLRKAKQVTSFELEMKSKNGDAIPVMISAILDKEIISGMMIDMREIKQSRTEIDKLSKAIEQIDDSVVITDKVGVITYANEAFYDLTGFTKEETYGSTSRILKSGQHDDEFYKKLWKTILSGKVFKGVIINKKKNGDIYYENKTISPLKDEHETLIGFVSTGKDVTLETLMYEHTKQLASTDKLTGLYNRHKFEELYALEAERARRFSSPLSMILIDIDHFKTVNDKYGHDVGDTVLIKLADILQTGIRKIDILVRWGGEEFIVLCSNTDIQNAQILAEKFRSEIEATTFETIKHATISLGVSVFEQGDTLQSFFKRADEALYSAKANGRNQVCVK